MQRPFLIGIGAAKSATTWVFDILSRHPDVVRTPIKEIHFFDQLDGVGVPFPTRFCDVTGWCEAYRRDHQPDEPEYARTVAWFERYISASPLDGSWYRSLFDHGQDGALAVDISPGYALMSPMGFERMREIVPQAKLLFIMRNPIDRSWSQFRRDVLQRTTKPISPDHMIRLLNQHEYDHSLYEIGLSGLTGAFPDEAVMLAFYEDITQRPAAFIERLCRFAALDYNSLPARDYKVRVNSTQLSADMPAIVRDHLRERYRPTVAAVKNRFGRVPEQWTADFGERL